MKRGKEACDSPRINARRFEEMIVGNIRSNILTDGNIRALVKVVDERMDGVAGEQRKRLETIEDELEDVKRKLAASGTWWRPPTPTWPTPRTASKSTGSGSGA